MSLVGFTRIGQIVMPTIVGSHSDFVAYLKYADFQNTSGDINAILDKLDDGGGDLRFSTDESGANQVPCEIVEFDKVGESAQVWVGGLTAATGQIIHLWGNKTGESQPDVTDTYGRNATWSDFEYCFHFQSNGRLVDSTGNYSLLEVGTVLDVEGAIGDGADSQASNLNYFEVDGYLGPTGSIARTHKMWIKPSSTKVGLLHYGGDGAGNRITTRIESGSLRTEVQGTYAIASQNLTIDEWHQVVAKFDGTSIFPACYSSIINGSVQTFSSTGSNRTLNTLESANVKFFDAKINRANDVYDEYSLRIFETSDELDLTEYQNQSSVGAWGTTTAVSSGNNYVINGDSSVTVLPSADFSIQRTYTISGDVPVELTPVADFLLNRSYNIGGQSSLELSPNSGFELNREYLFSGYVPFNILPDSETLYSSGNSIDGDVSYSVIPNSLFEITRSYSIDGLTNIDFVVQSNKQKNINIIIEGNVPVEITPSANFQFGIENIIDGDVNFNITPSSSFVFNRQYVLNGSIGINLTPDSETETTKNYIYNGQSEVSFSVEGEFEFDGQKLINGDVQINLIPNSLNSVMVLSRASVIKDPLFTLSVEDEVITLSVESSIEVIYAVAR